MAKDKEQNIKSNEIVEILFEDFYRKKWRVLGMNFLRGTAFGIGSVLGGTVVVALIVWGLSLMVDLPGGVGDFIEYIVDQVQNK